MEDDWVVDSLVGFLQSPVWKSPVEIFMEEKCIVFDKSDEDEPAYKLVYSEYKTMVNKLMETFMCELGVTEAQMIEALTKTKNLTEEHEKMLQPLLATGDYEVFKAIMVQKNVDLELRALALLEKQLGQSFGIYGHNSSSPSPREKLAEHRRAEEEQAVQDALSLSRQESELKLAEDREMEKLLEMAVQESLKLSQIKDGEGGWTKVVVDESSSTEESKDVDFTKVEDEEHISIKAEAVCEDSKEMSRLDRVPPIKGATLEQEISGQQAAQLWIQSAQSPPSEGAALKQEISGQQAAQLWIQSAKSELESNRPPTVKLQQHTPKKLPDELGARERYLKNQRDRLLERKRVARDQQLKHYKKMKKSSPPPSNPVHFGQTEAREDSASSSNSNRSSAVLSEEEATSPRSSSRVLCNIIIKKLKEEQV